MIIMDIGGWELLQWDFKSRMSHNAEQKKDKMEDKNILKMKTTWKWQTTSNKKK